MPCNLHPVLQQTHRWIGWGAETVAYPVHPMCMYTSVCACTHTHTPPLHVHKCLECKDSDPETGSPHGAGQLGPSLQPPAPASSTVSPFLRSHVSSGSQALPPAAAERQGRRDLGVWLWSWRGLRRGIAQLGRGSWRQITSASLQAKAEGFSSK